MRAKGSERSYLNAKVVLATSEEHVAHVSPVLSPGVTDDPKSPMSIPRDLNRSLGVGSHTHQYLVPSDAVPQPVTEMMWFGSLSCTAHSPLKI